MNATALVRRNLLAITALSLVLCALLGDWVVGELFMRRDTIAHVSLALALNALAFAVVIALVCAVARGRAASFVLRVVALLGFAGLLTGSLRSVAAPAVALGPVARFVLIAAFAVAAAVLAWKLSDELNQRLMQAIALASIAFLVIPVVARLLAPAPREWIAPEAAAATVDARKPRHATLFLLLDELGYAAAAPLVADLRLAELQVRYIALVPAGANTLNVIPAMFSGLDFSRARACGPSALCSDSNMLDFSAIRVSRPDVHVTGMLLPYCDIQGLSSCFQVPLLHEFGSSYRGLLVFYFRRLGLELPTSLRPPTEPADEQRRLLRQQTAFIDGSRFWNDGGVMYAHLPIPHPPGLDGQSTLDGDYAANIDAARAIVKSYAERLRSGFGDEFSIIVTSDHPLRRYWCDSGTYLASNCSTRPEFSDDKVPLILASRRAPPAPRITSNRDVFQMLNLQAAR